MVTLVVLNCYDEGETCFKKDKLRGQKYEYADSHSLPLTHRGERERGPVSNPRVFPGIWLCVSLDIGHPNE